MRGCVCLRAGRHMLTVHYTTSDGRLAVNLRQDPFPTRALYDPSLFTPAGRASSLRVNLHMLTHAKAIKWSKAWKKHPQIIKQATNA